VQLYRYASCTKTANVFIYGRLGVVTSYQVIVKWLP